MIIKLPDGSYQLRSEKGRKMGNYDTKYEARKRLKKIEKIKHIEGEKEIQEGYYSDLAAGLIEEKPKKLTPEEIAKKKQRDEEFKKKIPLSKKPKRSISETVAGIAAPDIKAGSTTTVGINSRDNKIMRPPVLKLNLKSEVSTDLQNMYGSALKKGKEDEEADNAAKEYLEEGIKDSVKKMVVNLKDKVEKKVNKANNFVKDMNDKHPILKKIDDAAAKRDERRKKEDEEANAWIKKANEDYNKGPIKP